LYIFIDGRQQIEGFQIQGAEKCLFAVGGMTKLNVKEFYGLHSSPNRGRSGKHGRGKLHKKYDGKKSKGKGPHGGPRRILKLKL
jgi:hypothetical protein